MAGYVHAKSPVAQELDSDREIRVRKELTRITDNSLCNHTALASLFSVKVVLSRAACHPSDKHRLNRCSSPVPPPGTGERLTVPEALSCSKEFDMIAIADWVSQSAMLWLWDCFLRFWMWRKRKRIWFEFKSKTPPLCRSSFCQASS